MIPGDAPYARLPLTIELGDADVYNLSPASGRGLPHAHHASRRINKGVGHTLPLLIPATVQHHSTLTANTPR